jgi:ketosteroid isomerase-like protein
MTAEEPLATEDAFFEALVKADTGRLGSILAEDFLIVDILRGDVTGRADFLAAVSAQAVTFHRVDPAERQVRRYGTTAVVTGRTQMSGTAGGGEFTVASRYTHVFVRTGTGAWKLVSAQGTPIAG